jgi:hypothetical protein
MNFAKPQSLNGAQLKSELAAVGIVVEEILDNSNGEISFEIPKSKESAALQIVLAHVGVDSVYSIEEKLASVGLSLNDLKIALGL